LVTHKRVAARNVVATAGRVIADLSLQGRHTMLALIGIFNPKYAALWVIMPRTQSGQGLGGS
jgi:hypothetical protein